MLCHTYLILSNIESPIKQGSSSIVYLKRDQIYKCKIGQSKYPHKRIKTLQTGNPLPLLLIATTPSNLLSEKDCHEKYNTYRTKGEWFDFPSDVLLGLYKTFQEPKVSLIEESGCIIL